MHLFVCVFSSFFYGNKSEVRFPASFAGFCFQPFIERRSLESTTARNKQRCNGLTLLLHPKAAINAAAFSVSDGRNHHIHSHFIFFFIIIIRPFYQSSFSHSIHPPPHSTPNSLRPLLQNPSFSPFVPPLLLQMVTHPHRHPLSKP